MTTDLWARALRHALHDHRDLSPDETERVAYQPHGRPLVLGTGQTVVQLQQTFAGIPILRAVRSVRFHEQDGPRVTGHPVRITVDGLPDVTIPATEAAYAASLRVAEETGVEVSNRRPRETAVFPHPDRPTAMRKRGFRDPITARLRLLAGDGGPTLVWQVGLEVEDEPGPWSVLVSATGREPEVLRAEPLAAHVVTGPVHDLSPPTDTPGERTFPQPREAYPHFDGGTLPAGPWLDADRTAGNNAAVVDDHGAPFTATPGAGGDLVFAPADPLDLDQARVNAFYLCNFLHDFLYLLGFDEAKGNFQERNGTEHGLGEDSVRVFVSSRSRPAFAFFVNRLDGRRPDLVLRPGPGGRHAGLDADVVLHEYTHGLTDRIVGRGVTERPFREPQSVALAEGFSDYFALTIQNHQRRKADLDPVHAFGAWISGNPTGLRAASYGPGFTATYGTLRNPGFDRHHDAGQVWCQTLLEVNHALGAGDPDVGDERGWQLVFDTICRLHPGPEGPHFLHARDALYDALEQRVASWGVDGPTTTRTVKGVFAARGMGPGAKSGSAGYDEIEEAFQELSHDT